MKDRRRVDRALFAATTSLLVLAGGCNLGRWVHNGFKVGPNYFGPPPAAVADDWLDSNDPQVSTRPPEYPDWWTALDDPTLNHLIETAYQQNLTLREAGLRVLQARAQRAIVAGNLFPQTQQASGSFSREQISLVAQPFLAPLPDFRRSFDAWSLGSNLSWELDIWGRFRRAVDAADASLDASVASYDGVLICLIAEVATAYTDIRTFQQRLAYARRNVEIQEASFELAKTRTDEGKTDKVGVSLAESNLEETRRTIQPLEIGLRQANNRLCTLLGIPPEDLIQQLGDDQSIPRAPSEVALGIPADLLRRRPDVRAAEARVAVQSEQIGIAIADFFPQISIAGEIAVEAELFSDLFSSGSLAGNVGPSFGWKILNYGRIVNNVRLQDERLAELVTNYQNTVLTANQEVEDAPVAFLRTQREVSSAAASAAATRRALELEIIRFKEGETDFTGVFVLQGDFTSKQDELAATRGDVITSLIGVYKALGGGWEIRCGEPTPHLPTGGSPREVSPWEEIPTPPVSTEQELPGILTEEMN